MFTNIHDSSPASDLGREYNIFAPVYNDWLAEDFCIRAVPALNTLFLNHIAPESHILDVCCGTGQMARVLLKRGHRVTGIDSSQEMLRFAKQNAQAATFIATDVRELAFPRRFDAVISTFNSFAHIHNIADLQRVFEAIRNVLQPGSPFVFDLNMEEAYVSKWRGSFGMATSEHACVIRPVYDPDSRTAINHITLFQAENSVWRRHDFQISQKCHSKSDLHSALSNAGFDHVSDYDAEFDLGMTGESGRSFFLCR